MGYPLRPKNLKKSGFNDDNIAALRDLQRRVSALTEGQPNTDGVGALTWDEDRGTYNIAGTGETSFKIGEDLVYYAKNTSGSTIPIGSSVMFTGAVGASGLLTFGLAVADGSVDPDYMMGITQQEIPNNGFGYVKHFGLLRGFRTDGSPQGETWSDGDLLYFDAATPGGLTKVKPVSPAIHEPIAVVVTASSGNSGSIFVRMKVSESLATLRDVYVNGSLANGDVLIYDVTQDRFEANTLTAGANITITNGPGSITISSAGGVETDPIFTASPAFGITSGDISNWNTAYGWGNHALAGYLTSYTETDPTVPSHVKSITTTNISNWNTAYGWGDHSAAGYLTSFSETDPTVPSHVKSITTTNISNWNTAYGWGDHAAAGYQAAATALTTSTTFGGDVSGTYNNIIVADDSHNHIIANVDGLQTALDGKLSTTGKAADSDLLDGIDSTQFLRSDAADTATGRLTFDGGIEVRSGTGGGKFRIKRNTGSTDGDDITDIHMDDSGTFFDIDNDDDGDAGIFRFRKKSGGSWVAPDLYAGSDKVFNDGYAPFDGLTDKTSGTGIYTTSGSFRASIFYDVNNTSYFVNAADNNTKLNGMVSTGRIDMQSTDGYQLESGKHRITYNDGGGNFNIRVGHKYNNESTETGYAGWIEYTQSNGQWEFWTTDASYTAGTTGITFNKGLAITPLNTYLYYNNSVRLTTTNAGLTVTGAGTATSYFRAPIFYDSDNTSFYVNPNGTSEFSSLTLSGAQFWKASNGAYQRVDSRVESTNYSRAHWYGVTSTGGTTNFRHAWYNGSSYINVTADATGVDFSGTLRSTLLYDRDNTAYYINGAGTSNLNALTLAGVLTSSASATRDKLRVWNSSSYTIGMDNAMSYGGLNDYAMTFQMNNDSDRGFWWGDTSHTDAQGAMSLTTTGELTVASNLSVGAGQSTTSASAVQLTVAGAAGVDGIDLQVDTTNSVNSGRMFWTNGTAGQGVAIYNGAGNMYLTTGATPNSTSGGTRMAIYSGNYVTASGSFRAPIFYDSNNTGRYADLSSTGDSIRASGDIVAYYSDDRLKDRGDNIANALDKVQSLNGFHYTANETAQKFGYKANPQVGVSAQEVEAVLPEVVKDAAIGHGYKTVDYAKLVPLLIEAIKELKAEVETLKKG